MPALEKRRARRLFIAIGFLPAVGLIIGAYRDVLGANPIETITHTTGDYALRFLFASLAVTPLRRLLHWNDIVPYRRLLGLLSFFYACLHFSTWLVLDLFFDWSAIAEDITERPYVTAGFTAFLCLLPLAITSTRGWIRRLGKNWARLHRLAYVAGTVAVIHYWWLAKGEIPNPRRYAVLLVVLLLIRVWFWLRSRSASRART